MAAFFGRVGILYNFESERGGVKSVGNFFTPGFFQNYHSVLSIFLTTSH